MKYLRLENEAVLIGDKNLKIQGMEPCLEVVIVNFYGENQHKSLFVGTEEECQNFLDLVLRKFDHIYARPRPHATA